MNKALEKLKKLRGRTPDELRVRGTQMLSARAERYGLYGGARIPADAALFRLIDEKQFNLSGASAESLIAHFRARTSPRFFASLVNREETISELLRRFGPDAGEAVIARAGRICAGRFDLLGFYDLEFGAPPDFHLEPTLGKKSPLIHWSCFDELGTDLTGDKKIVWELNRCQYFTILGRAYWHTLDEAYARAFVAHLNAWMDQNPPGLGINWTSSLEVALRAVAWLWALYFFRDSPHLTPKIYLRALKFLYLHATHLERYLSTYSSPNTHLTGEALGLFYLGTMLPEFRAAGRWRANGERILLGELSRHVRSDGVYFEQSSYYHRYTTDFYTHLYILARANGERPAHLLEEKLTSLLDHSMYITRPDGTTPFFGDDDGGRLVMLDESAPNDFRAALSTGAALFARADYKYVAGGATEETLWLLGREGLASFDDIDARSPENSSRAFNEGGYYVMRDAWTKEANYLLIDCGPHGALSCGHSHADALSIEVAARGHTLLIDPGTYTYTGSLELRDAFRSSAAHNTLTLDNESSSVPGGPFSWQTVAAASARDWISHERFDYFEGSHDGYARLREPAAHTRSILFLKDDYWIMRDRIMTAGSHLYDLRFHFAADAGPTVETGSAAPVVRESKIDKPGLDLTVFGKDGGQWRSEEGWVSACYGQRSSAPVCVFSVEAEDAQEFVTFLVPSKAGGRVTYAREIEAGDGRAFEVCKDKVRDLLLLADAGQTIKATGIASDFAWTWLRFERDSRRLKELVLLGGRRLEIDGEELFAAAERTAFVFVTVKDDELHVETEAKGEFTVAGLGASRVLVNGQARDLKR